MSRIINKDTHVQLLPRSVIYRTKVHESIRVVKIFWYTGEPRIMALVQDFRNDDRFEPLSLFLSEIYEIINDSAQRLNIDPTTGLRIAKEEFNRL